ncbi:MAG: hypothetical protein AAB614_03465 [Patescibacteria group bacterium]
MKIISTTKMRKDISEIINEVKYKDRIFGIGRRDKIEAIIMRYPKNLNSNFDEITNINSNSASFDFLEDEPDIYNVEDLKQKYV